jgi:hypothetical protein
MGCSKVVGCCCAALHICWMEWRRKQERRPVIANLLFFFLCGKFSHAIFFLPNLTLERGDFFFLTGVLFSCTPCKYSMMSTIRGSGSFSAVGYTVAKLAWRVRHTYPLPPKGILIACVVALGTDIGVGGTAVNHPFIQNDFFLFFFFFFFAVEVHSTRTTRFPFRIPPSTCLTQSIAFGITLSSIISQSSLIFLNLLHKSFINLVRSVLVDNIFFSFWQFQS